MLSLSFLRATALVRWPPPLPWLRWLHAAGVRASPPFQNFTRMWELSLLRATAKVEMMSKLREPASRN